MQPQTLPQDILFSPSDVSRLGMENLQARIENKSRAVPFGLASVDAVYLPLLAGELETVIARPGNGKTGLMIHRARQRARFLQKTNVTDRVVCYVTCEQTVEELYTFGVAAETGLNISDMARGNIDDAQWLKIEISSLNQGVLPLWLIGPSKKNRRKRPKITVSAIVDAIFHLEDTAQKKADIVFVDYLQLVKPEGRVESKVIATTEILERCKDGALSTDCGWVVGVQARRDVDVQALPIPGLDAGQWTSGVEQFSDKVFSLVRPSKYKRQGENFGSQTVQGHSQLLVTLLKQKLGKDNQAFWTYFDPAYNKLHELEGRYAV